MSFGGGGGGGGVGIILRLLYLLLRHTRVCGVFASSHAALISYKLKAELAIAWSLVVFFVSDSSLKCCVLWWLERRWADILTIVTQEDRAR